jgi:hypothetical protein
MGSVSRVIKKTKKAVTKPLSKAFKGIAKGIKKVGKATMRGVAKINKKLGPLGSIALAVAMPYALGGLSNMIGVAGGQTGLMNSSNIFLKSIGNVGNAIRTGYQGFTGAVSNTFSSITNSIKRGFTKFAPKGEGNIFSRISKGAKNLFQSAKEMSQKYSPIKGKQGTVQVSDGLDQVYTMTSEEAGRAIGQGKLDVADITKQTLGSDKWFVQGSKEADKIITNTINNAYSKTTSQYSPDALRYFNDLKSKAIDMKTYVNDAEIGDVVEKYATNIQTGTADLDITSTIDLDLGKTGDYNILNEEGTEYAFNGNKTYGTGDKATGFSTKAKAAGKTAVSSLLKKKDTPVDITKVDFSFGQGKGLMTDITGTYGGTDIYGSAGGNLLQGVYSDADRMKIMNYYKNMNIIGSS